jgi:hypothetical protein
MRSHSYDSTYDDAHQQLEKDSFLVFFLLLVSHFVFLVHFKETNISAVHFPDSNQVQRTFPPISSRLTQHHMTSQTTSIITMPKHHRSKPPSPTNVNAFPAEGWMTKDRLIKCVVSGRIGKIIGYEDYYFKNKQVLCTRAFSTSAIATTIDDGVNLTMPQVTTARC